VGHLEVEGLRQLLLVQEKFAGVLTQELLDELAA
jgi:hypothetical protein